MADITTSLTAALNRAIDNTIDAIAVDGLQALRNILDSSGFRKSDYLKDYEVYSHVTGHEITFEIVLSVEAVEPSGPAVQDLQDQVNILKKKVETKKVARTYGLTDRGPQLIIGRRDIRKPAKDARRDARRPAKSAFKTAQDRLVGHEISMRMPRSLEVKKGGKLSISFRRSTRSTREAAFVMPQTQFSGVPQDFVQKLKSIVVEKFGPELSAIIKRYG